MNIVLFDTEARKKLFPLTLTRAIADIRMGILTIKERWEKLTRAAVFILTDDYLQLLYSPILHDEYIFIDAGIIPDQQIIKRIFSLNHEESFADEMGLVAGRASITFAPLMHELSKLFPTVTTVPAVKRIEYPHQLFQWNDDLLRFDFELLTKGRISANADNSVQLIKPSNIFIEEGADVRYCHLNASEGPIYIDKNSTIMEGCLVRGPLALCEGAVLKMGTRITGATTIGPFCTAGGEIKNSILTSYSNKAHDGYLGDSVIGEWCNLGAGTTNSNVKNTGGDVKAWNYFLQDYKVAGNKCGVIMGDHSRTAINSSINTGTVTGVCSNVFGEGLTPNFIPDFSWGSNGQVRYDFHKAMRDIANWKKMKNKTLSESETQILKHIFDHL